MPVRPFNDQYPQIDPSAYVDPSAVVIGQVEVEAQASIWPMVVARGDVERIHIGARSNVQDGTILHVTHDGPYSPGGQMLWIGEDVTVGHQVTLHACRIEHHCLIGIQSVVLDGAVLEPYTLLAAGSVVPPGRRLQGGHLWRGSPAKMVRELTDEEKQRLDYSASQYVKLAQQHALQIEKLG